MLLFNFSKLFQGPGKMRVLSFPALVFIKIDLTDFKRIKPIKFL